MKLWLLLLAASVWLEMAPLSAQVEITRGPYLQSLLDTSVTVIWWTGEPCRGKVKFSAAGGPDRFCLDETPCTIHRLTMDDLFPGTVYQYQVLEGDRLLSEEVFQFRTSPLPGDGAIRVAVAGDTGSGDEHQHAVARVIEEMAPDLFIHTGDLIYILSEDEAIFEPYKKIFSQACFYPSYGNHDEILDWPSLFHLPDEHPEDDAIYYSFDWGSAHFVALDSDHDFTVDGEQFLWLEADLQAAREKGLPWTILFFHKPVITVGAYSYSCWAIRQTIAPIIDKFEVDLVLNGHDHNYQRSYPFREEVVRDGWQNPNFVSPRGTIYLVTGGGGGYLYSETHSSDHRYTERFNRAYQALEMEITETRISVRAISAEKKILDSFILTKGEPRPQLEFTRGDVDFNGELEITDVIVILHHLFGKKPMECPLVGKIDGIREPLSLTDPIYLLEFLFTGGLPPAPPFPECGTDPLADDAWCKRSGCP